MTQTGMVASGALTDWISLGVLASAVPRDAVDDAVEAAGRGAKRVRREAPAALITGEYSRPSGTMLKRYPGGKLCEPTVTELFS